MKEPLESGRRVVFVIITWNRKPRLRECLDSVSRYIQKPHPILVVDNASKDGTSEMIKSEYPNVTLLRNSENKGFSRAANQGLNHLDKMNSEFDYVIFLNDDAEFKDSSLSRLIDYMQQNPPVQAALPSVFSSPGELQTGVGGYDLNLKTAFYYFLGWSVLFPSVFPGFFIHQPYFRKKGIVCELDWVSGVCLVLRREAAEKFRFPEDFFMYAEDVALGQEIKKQGKIIYFPFSQIFHIKEESRSFPASCLWLDSLFKYYRQKSQEPKSGRLRLLKVIFMMGFLIRILGYAGLELLAGKDYQPKRRELWSYSRHIWRSLTG